MALSLGVGIGSKIDIGGVIAEVKDIVPQEYVELIIFGRPYIITSYERVEVIPDVFISLGNVTKYNTSKFSRIAIEAPKDIKIVRVKDGRDN